MELLEQCRLWFEQEGYQKVIDALEAIRAEDRTPEMDSELAKAYIAAADIGDRASYEKAIELLAPHEEHFKGDHCWNYRMGAAYYYLDQEGPALRYFEKALEARPGDQDTLGNIDDCRNRLALPRFENDFRARTEEAWAAFAGVEAEMRRIIDTDRSRERGEELLGMCSDTLRIALSGAAFELGYDGERYELVLSPEGSRAGLFPLVYFQRHAPESVRAHWDIRVGRQSSEDFFLRAGETEVRAEDVQVWAEKTPHGQVDLALQCEKLLPLLKDAPDKAGWILSMLTDQVLGEVTSIASIGGFDLCAEPKEEPSILLSELPQAIQEMGLPLWPDAEEYLENSYIAYELEPVEDPDADWRLDVFTGTCRLPVLINDYMAARSDAMDDYHRDGIVAGFLCYPLSGFTGEERSKAILDFRDALREAILRKAGEDAVTFLGGATGLYNGYLDFIAWDLFAVLTAAQEFFRESGLPWAQFHTFRRDVGGVPLLEADDSEPDVHEETGSLLSAEDIELLSSFEDGKRGYWGKMLQWLESFVEEGVKAGRFTEKQAHRDLQIALWYSFACNNLDDYIYYYRAIQWMKESEISAKGCGTWYYRYSVALMYCGRLEEALRYAEQGAREEPDYPWIWLQVGKLRAHFGDKAGALEAARQGLELEPGDYEFLTLEREIRAGATLEQMLCHWIDPEADASLQAGEGEDAEDKLSAIACVTADEAGLDAFYQLFHPEQYGYTKNGPCCEFRYPAAGHSVELSFRMNEAGLSRLGTEWLRQLKDQLDSGAWLTYTPEDGPEGTLEAVFVAQDRRVGLVYRQPGDDQYFQIFRDADGSQYDAIWSSDPSEREDTEDDEPSDLKGSFVGFVLLSEPSWDKGQLIRDLEEKWGIAAEEDEEASDDSLIFTVGDGMAAVSMMPAPIPDGEAEAHAENNYFWPEAVAEARAHKAHLMVAAIGGGEDALELGKLYTKVLAACCRQKHATGIYASGVVFEPSFYEGFADMMQEDALPIFNWVWFGLYMDEDGLCGYTDGLDQFGKEEIEVLGTDAEPEALRDFMASLVSYVLENDVELHDGETIGFSAEDKHAITRSEGVALPGQMTLKIDYEPSAGV